MLLKSPKYPELSDQELREFIKENAEKVSAEKLAKELGISMATAYRYIREVLGPQEVSLEKQLKAARRELQRLLDQTATCRAEIRSIETRIAKRVYCCKCGKVEVAAPKTACPGCIEKPVEKSAPQFICPRCGVNLVSKEGQPCEECR